MNDPLDSNYGLTFDLPPDSPSDPNAAPGYAQQVQQQFSQQMIQGAPHTLATPAQEAAAAAAAAAAAGLTFVPNGGETAGHYGSSDEYEDEDESETGFFSAYTDDEDFRENLEYGLIDNGLLLSMALAGVSLDGEIEKRTGVAGYGVILGAVLGNALADALGASRQGTKATVGAFVGALIPVIPVGIALGMKREIKGTTRNVLLGTSVALLVGTTAMKHYRKRKSKK